MEQQLPQFQTEEMLDNFEVIADYIMDNLEFYFKEKIQNAKESSNYMVGERFHYGKNDNIFNQLNDEFSTSEASRAKGPGASANSVRQMLKNWKKQGLIIQTGKDKFKKAK